MLKRTPENLERLRQLVECCKQGNTTVHALSEQMSLSGREIYRYLAMGKTEGLIYQPVRGRYCSKDRPVPSKEEYMHGSTWMSQEDKHNKTQPNSSLVSFTKSTKEPIKAEMISDGTTVTQVSGLDEIVTRVLDVAGFKYCGLDFRRARRVLCEGGWDRINQDNVYQLVAETGRRFHVRLEAGVIRRHPISYFFGILKNVLSEQVQLRDRTYKDFVDQYSSVAGGAEESAACLAVENGASERPQTDFYPQDSANTTHGNSSQPLGMQRSVPAEWLEVQTLLRKMVDAKSAYLVSDDLLQRVVYNMIEDGAVLERTMLGLSYMQANDQAGVAYFVSNLRNRTVVKDIVIKNHMRYLNYGIDGPQRTMVSSGEKPPHDQRYSAFYELFPYA